MGSLERVQFKFASIIGELCSEPILLSQFAVWLDMKLAEYKAKGSISLDCSGEKPEPPWMKGVLPPSPASLPTALFEENPTQDTNTDMSPFLKSSQNSQKSNFIRNQNQTSALSDRDLYNSETGVKPEDDFIVIKEEQGEQIDCIYESNSRLNDTVPQQSIDNYSEAAFRKRLSSSDSQYTSHTITSPSKIRRMSPASAALSSPSSAASNLNAGSSRDIHLDPSSSDRSMFPPSDQSQNSWLGQVTADREVESPGAEIPQMTSDGKQEFGEHASEEQSEGLCFSYITQPVKERKMVTCTKCGINFTRKSNFMEHFKTKHSKTGTNYCCVCGKVYRWRPSYKRHQRTCQVHLSHR